MNAIKKIEVGDFITVVKWKNSSDNSYKGDCMEVKVIDEPFLRVFRHNGHFKNDTQTLNIDQVELKILSKAFVDSVIESK